MVLEIGDSAYTEFKMKRGGFEPTEDAVLIESIEANSSEEALKKMYANKQHKDKDFHRLMICEVVHTQYL